MSDHFYFFVGRCYFLELMMSRFLGDIGTPSPLMSHTMKIYERVLNSRLRQIATLNENQCEFVEGKSTLDAIQSLRILVENYRDNYNDLHMVFIDLEKAFDRVPRDLIWAALRAQKVPEIFVKLIKVHSHTLATCRIFDQNTARHCVRKPFLQCLAVF